MSKKYQNPNIHQFQHLPHSSPFHPLIIHIIFDIAKEHFARISPCVKDDALIKWSSFGGDAYGVVFIEVASLVR